MIAPTGPGVKPLDIGPRSLARTMARGAAVEAFFGRWVRSASAPPLVRYLFSRTAPVPDPRPRRL